MSKPTLHHQGISACPLITIMAYLPIHKIGKVWANVEVDITLTQTAVPDISFLLLGQNVTENL